MTRAPYAGSMASAPNPYGSPSSAASVAGVGDAKLAGVGYSPSSMASNQQQQQQQQHQHQQQQLTSGGGGVGNTGANQQQQQQQHHHRHHHQMSKHLAHSNSLLASESYAAGMSSDSELTMSGSRHHHHRPYSSQSRVYHAHPAPRSTHTSSRVSYYSDSATANYVPAGAANEQQQQQQQHQQPPAASPSHLGPLPPQAAGQQQQQPPPPRHLTHQGSVSSTGSGGSASAYLGLADSSPISPVLHHSHHHSQQQQQRGQGRQLPHRPFKQSMSIDHQSVGHHHHHQYHHAQQQQQQPQHLAHHQTPPSSMGHLSSSPAHASLVASAGQPAPSHFEPNAGAGAAVELSSSSPAAYGIRAYGGPGAGGQRNFRLEMEMLEKQAANINLYDNERMPAGLPPTAGRPASSTGHPSSRHLPPTSPAGGGPSVIGSVDHLHHHHQMLEPQYYHHQLHHHPASTNQQQPHPIELQQQQSAPPAPLQQLQQHHHQQQHHHRQQQDLYASHQTGSSPADWLPPMGPLASHQQQLSRQQQSGSGGGGGQAAAAVAAHQFRQTMSIDHYSMAGQQQHYSPAARAAHFSDNYQPRAGAGGTMASSLAAYNTTAASGHYGDSPAAVAAHHHHHHQQLAYQQHSATSAVDLHHTSEPIYHQYVPEPTVAAAAVAHQQQQQQGASFSVNNGGSGGGGSSSQQQLLQGRNAQAELPAHLAHDCASSSAVVPVNSGGSTNFAPSAVGQAKLQHQMSSGSSNSQSGSLKSANLEATSSKSNQQQQQQAIDQRVAAASSGAMLSHYRQQSSSSSPQHLNRAAAAGFDQIQNRHGMGVTKGRPTGGHPSASPHSGLSGSGTALNSEPAEATSGGPAHMGTYHLGSYAVGKQSAALRASSPCTGTYSESAGGASAASSSSGGPTNQQQHHHHHHHLSSSSKDGVVVGGGGGTRSESSTGLPNGPNASNSSASMASTATNNSSLTKKSNSATQLSMTGTKKRLGFRKKQVTSFSVHRSEEVAPLEARHLVKQGSSVSEGDSSMSGDSSSRSWSNSNFKQQQPTADELASMSFIDGLGKGQMISRQGLASPYLGDIQLSLCDRRGNLEVEIIRARNLQAKTNKILPLTYVKLYLVKNRKCLAKAKTTLSNKRTLDPLFQQQLTFHEDYHGCILQSIIWGNFGKMDKKNFMGIAQISIDDLELSDTVVSWYKLFLPSSLQTLPSKSLRHTLLSNSTESFTNTNNS